jgi:hypothetical protein
MVRAARIQVFAMSWTMDGGGSVRPREQIGITLAQSAIDPVYE